MENFCLKKNDGKGRKRKKKWKFILPIFPLGIKSSILLRGGGGVLMDQWKNSSFRLALRALGSLDSKRPIFPSLLKRLRGPGSKPGEPALPFSIFM
jgi:hypothetical protein